MRKNWDWIILTIAIIIILVGICTPVHAADVQYIGPAEEPGTYAWMVDGEVHVSAVSPEMAQDAWDESVSNGKTIFWGLIVMVLVLTGLKEVYKYRY